MGYAVQQQTSTTVSADGPDIAGRERVMSTAVTERPLVVADRCDRCGAQAYVRATLPSGGELLFCAHHAREHEERLRDMAAVIYTETGKLADIPLTAAFDER
jgi:hypothetical protein